MQEQDNGLAKRFVEAFKAVIGHIKRALHWLLEGIRKRAKVMTTSSMRRTVDVKWEQTWKKSRMMHPHATLVVMKKRDRAHQDRRMMKRARSTLKS
ncbi:hypothetical protein [Exiguobacterium acetylicum]|uniref:hypothetical protein n=1 Tax=Exiguobacterium acetylicum TaxID=41170 RepID=UPI00301A14B7